MTSWPWTNTPEASVPVSRVDRLVDEVEEALLDRSLLLAFQQDPDASADVGLAARPDLLEQSDETLLHHFRQSFDDGLADDLTIADEPAIGCIGHLEPMFGPRQHRDEARRLLEQGAQPLSLLREGLVGFLHGVRALEDAGRLARIMAGLGGDRAQTGGAR